MTQTNTSQHIRIDERKHVEKPLVNQLTGTAHVTPFLTELQELGA